MPRKKKRYMKNSGDIKKDEVETIGTLNNSIFIFTVCLLVALPVFVYFYYTLFFYEVLVTSLIIIFSLVFKKLNANQ